MRIIDFFPLMALVFNTAVIAQPTPENKTAYYFESIQSSPQKLAAFLQTMPKGGDLHNHQSGAAYAENMMKYAYQDNLCVDPVTYTVSVNLNCESRHLLNNAVNDTVFFNNMIDAWSMRNFSSHKESGHDHFFAAFGKFSLIGNLHRGDILAEITQRAGMQNESYLELMLTPDGNESGKLGQKLGWDPDFANMRAKLLAADFDKIIEHISAALDQDEMKKNSLLSCGRHQAKIGCQVRVRYLYQVKREQAPEMVFAQLLAGFEAAKKDKRVVGLNMVQPEDGKISMRDYKLHMQMVGYLHQVYPDVYISLHAGELNSDLVPPEGLRFHIHDAVHVAKADRIGHGVDIVHEDNFETLLKDMADKHIMVEINLSSNAYILNIDGEQHPLPLYIRYGVPVALSTDDEGVSRSHLVKEYLRAVKTFHLDYLTLKTFARNSLTYSFLPGNRLWNDYAYQQVTPECTRDVIGSEKMSPVCKSFLDGNEKAKMQWDLEARFNKFESGY